MDPVFCLRWAIPIFPAAFFAAKRHFRSFGRAFGDSLCSLMKEFYEPRGWTGGGVWRYFLEALCCPFLPAVVPLATLMEPPIVRMMEPGGGTQRPKEVVSRLGSGVEGRQGRARLWRRRSGLGLVTGAEGGGPSLSTLGLRRERYDSPSTTRS